MLAALPLVAYLVVMFLIQFYGHAIVLDGTGAVAGLKRSVALVRRNRLRTLGYSVVGVVAGTVFGLGLFVSSFLLAADRSMYGLPATGMSTAGVAVGIVLIVVVQTLAGSAFATYSVAFYRRLGD